ncbi:MAG: single-stranded DNA-binding protein [Chloroflexi bacterium]|nr:single-stranded DNA-binding protein [Chloroflexota bacterium]
MASLNKIMVIGNLGTTPEMRYTPTGIPITSFRMATSRFYTAQDGERRQETEWFTVVARNRLAETCNQFLIKGKRVYVEGRLRSHTWEGPDGQSRFRNEIVADRVLFLDRQPIATHPTPQGEEPGDAHPGDAHEEAGLPDIAEDKATL